MEITNKELRDEIIKYMPIAKKDSEGKSFVTTVSCYNINDSVSMCVLYFTNQTVSWKQYPFQFICKIEGNPVLFTVSAFGFHWPRNYFFGIKSKAYFYFMKKYFPDEYANNRNGLGVLVRDYPREEYLAFYKGRIVGKAISGPFHEDLLKYKIGNKTFYYEYGM